MNVIVVRVQRSDDKLGEERHEGIICRPDRIVDVYISSSAVCRVYVTLILLVLY